MANPKENPNNSPDHSSIEAGKAQMPQGAPTDVHEKASEQEKDNVEFIQGFEKMTPVEKQKLLDKASEWEKGGDLDQLRAAGLSLDQVKKSPLDRHIRLAAMFLKRQPGSELTFRCNFNGNDYAETQTDLSDILPANILKVDILDSEGKLLFANAERGFKDGKPGYFTADSKKVFLRENFVIKIKASQSSSALADQRLGRQSYDHAFKEQIYLTENDQKTQLKKKAQEEATKQGKTFLPDPKFFDQSATEVTRSPKLDDFFKDGQFDFSKIMDQIKKFVSDFGVMLSQATKDFGKSFDSQEATKKADPKKPEDIKPAREDSTPEKESLAKKEYQKLPADARDSKLVQKARSFKGSTDFRGADVAGGNLACAKVASTILKEAGVMDDVVLNVDGVESALLRKGWQKHPAPATGGDVVIWGRTPAREKDGIVQPGHKHVGIMTDNLYSVNNNSTQHMPVESKVDFNSPRGVYLLSPPHRKASQPLANS